MRFYYDPRKLRHVYNPVGRFRPGLVLHSDTAGAKEALHSLLKSILRGQETRMCMPMAQNCAG